MALFAARARRANNKKSIDHGDASLDGDEVHAEDGPAPEPQPAVRLATRPSTASRQSLRDALQDLYAMRPRREAFAQEATGLIASAAGVKACALFGYEQRKDRVHLLSSIGLTEDAIRTLSGDTALAAWDIPVRSVRNRRINVMESAHENPFVPKALVDTNPRRLTIAALPFYHANIPVGVIVLFSPTARGFTDRTLQMLSQALRICALALGELPASEAGADRASDDAEAPRQPSLLRGLAALKSELARLTAALEEAERLRAAEAAERVTAQSFLRATKERSALVEKEVVDLREEHHRIPELQTQIDQLTQQLDEAVQAGDAAQTQVAELQAALSDNKVQMEASGGRIGELATAHDALQQQLDAALAQVGERNETVRTLQGDVAELTDRATAADELRAGVRELESHRRQLQGELSRVHEESEKELTELRSQLQAGDHDRRELAARAESATTDAAELSAAREAAELRAAELERGLHVVRDEQLADMTARLHTSEETRQTAEAELQRARERGAAELGEIGERLAISALEQERLTRVLEEKDMLLESAEQGLTAIDLADGEEEAEQPMLAIDRSCAPQNEDASRADSEADFADETDAGEVVLLDDNEIGAEAARQLAEFGHRVTRLDPNPECTDQLGERSIACAAVNLAIPSAWPTMRKLRNGSAVQHMPLVAYALAADAPKGFWLGPIDFAFLPTEGSDLVHLLRRMVPRLKRVIAMSNDIDVMGDVRMQLTEAGISTAVVLDGRQALDLVPTVRPEAAVLHLSPSCVDVFRAISGLRSSENSRNIPILFLLDADAQPREEAFLTAGVSMLSSRGGLAPSEIVDSLASAVDVYRAGA